MSGRRRCLTAIALLIIIAAVTAPSLAYRENQFELRSGNLLFQSQFYTTSPTQTLFHSQTAAGSDTEAFAFAPATGGGFDLAQTSSGDVVASDTGFYTATFSFLKFNCPTGEGYMHTSIGDPLVSRTPVFSSLLFPDMIKKESLNTIAGGATPVGTPGTKRTAKNSSANKTAAGMPSANVTGNMTARNLTTMEPLINKQVSTDVGVEDTTNALAVTPRPTLQPTSLPTPQPAPSYNAMAANASGKASPKPTLALTPTPTPKPPYAVLPEASTLLTKPMSRQSNKPFTYPLDPDYNPRVAKRSEVRNISGWDRLTTNVIGRSGIDSTYQNRTSAPSYINPWKVIKLADQFKVMSDSMNMTHSDSYLQQRMWAL
jgi:hypothetical protein